MEGFCSWKKDSGENNNVIVVAEARISSKIQVSVMLPEIYVSLI